MHVSVKVITQPYVQISKALTTLYK